MKIKLSKNQSGFTHVILMSVFAVLVLGAIGGVGYRAYKDGYRTVSFEGVFSKQKCTSTTPGCTGYSLAASNSKKYNLAITSPPKVASGTSVTVTGTSKTSSTGRSTIAVTTIIPTPTPVNPPTPIGNPPHALPLPITVTETNNGQTIDMVVGEELIVDLPNYTNWPVSSDTNVIAQQGQPTQQPSAIACVVGAPCGGNITTDFETLTVGQSTITATHSTGNTVCSPDSKILGCPGNPDTYTVTIVVMQ